MYVFPSYVFKSTETIWCKKFNTLTFFVYSLLQRKHVYDLYVLYIPPKYLMKNFYKFPNFLLFLKQDDNTRYDVQCISANDGPAFINNLSLTVFLYSLFLFSIPFFFSLSLFLSLGWEFIKEKTKHARKKTRTRPRKHARKHALVQESNKQ